MSGTRVFGTFWLKETNIGIIWSIVLLLSCPAAAQQNAHLNSSDVVPRISFPGISQPDFQHAFDVMQGCVVTDLPVYGFTHPFMYPGGLYDRWWYRIDSVNILGMRFPRKAVFEKYWWEIDGSLTLSGAKWVNEEFAENVLRDFTVVQRIDGRIPLFALDSLAVMSSVSALPTLSEIGYTIARRTSDTALVRSVFLCLRRYLDWWLSYSVRRDSVTGLITGVFEESLPSDEGRPFNRAPVDLNTEVVLGCANVAKLADRLGDAQASRRYAEIGSQIKASMNRYLWADSAYYAYIVPEKRRETRLLCNTFDPFVENIAQGAQVAQLINLLTSDRYFGWDHNPVTTAAKTDSTYNETPGVYIGR